VASRVVGKLIERDGARVDGFVDTTPPTRVVAVTHQSAVISCAILVAVKRGLRQKSFWRN